MTLQKVQPKRIPVWVKLRNVPLEYWTDDGLSVVASAVGEPLFADVFTRSCLKLDYARVCVMLDAGISPVQFVIMVLPSCDGEKSGSCRVPVAYEWLPHRCVDCQVFRHRVQVCPRKQKPVVPKPGKALSVYVTKDPSVGIPPQVVVASSAGLGRSSYRFTMLEKPVCAVAGLPRKSTVVSGVGGSGTSFSSIDMLRISSVPVYSMVTTSSPIASPKRYRVGGFQSHNRFAALGEADGDVEVDFIIVDGSTTSSGPNSDAAHIDSVT